ncbi:hypothetical protein ABIA33_004827 [Streptacidiphilus sp. MAP12-16]|uniref:hypothetical protein n=1 Tax=Streptacidiphilus sp. MAP12-16 TaxID=3156300 RepID=UPI0035112CAF
MRRPTHHEPGAPDYKASRAQGLSARAALTSADGGTGQRGAPAASTTPVTATVPPHRENHRATSARATLVASRKDKVHAADLTRR